MFHMLIRVVFNNPTLHLYAVTQRPCIYEYMNIYTHPITNWVCYCRTHSELVDCRSAGQLASSPCKVLLDEGRIILSHDVCKSIIQKSSCSQLLFNIYPDTKAAGLAVGVLCFLSHLSWMRVLILWICCLRLRNHFQPFFLACSYPCFRPRPAHAGYKLSLYVRLGPLCTFLFSCIFIL